DRERYFCRVSSSENSTLPLYFGPLPRSQNLVCASTRVPDSTVIRYCLFTSNSGFATVMLAEKMRLPRSRVYCSSPATKCCEPPSTCQNLTVISLSLSGLAKKAMYSNFQTAMSLPFSSSGQILSIEARWMAWTKAPSEGKREGRRLSVMTMRPLKTSSGLAAKAAWQSKSIPRTSAVTRFNFNIVTSCETVVGNKKSCRFRRRKNRAFLTESPALLACSLMSRALNVKAGTRAVDVGATSLPTSADYTQAVAEAQTSAASAGRALGSVDLLLGMLRAGGAAARVLAERGISAAAVEVLAAKARPDEGPDAGSVLQTSREIAVGLGATQTDSLHLLLALLRDDGAATATLKLAGADAGKLRAVVMRVLTGPAEQRERRFARTPAPTIAEAPLRQPANGARPLSIEAPRLEQPSSVPEPAQEPATGRGLAPIAPPHVPVLYREREVGRLLDLLAAKTARVIALVGDMGSGRTALLSALAAASLDPPVIPVGDVGAPTSPGALLQSLHRSAPVAAPIVLDSVAWLGPDGSDGALQLLASAAAGRRWILCLTPADLRRIELEQADLRHAIEIVALPSPEPAMLLEMIETGLDALRTEDGLAFAPDVAQALVRLSPRYPCERAQPGRALAIAEVGLARAERRGQNEVTARDIAEVIADASGVPASQLRRDEDERFRALEQRLAERVVGHAEARSKIASVLRRSDAGFRGRKTLASLL